MRAMAFLTFALLPTFLFAQVSNPANDHTYFRTETRLQFATARLQAEKVQGYVVSLTSEEEELWVDDQFFGHKWIGLTDEVEEGVFAWDSGEPLDYTHWPGSGQPPTQDFGDLVTSSSSGWINRDDQPFLAFAVIETEEPLGPTISGVTCGDEAGMVELSWSNPGGFTAIEVYRGVELLATLDGIATSFQAPTTTGPEVYWILPLGGSQLARPVSCATVAPPFVLYPESTTLPPQGTGTVRVLLDNEDEILAYSYSLCHDPDLLTVLDVEPGAGTAGGKPQHPIFFYAPNISLDGGFTIGVIVERNGFYVLPPGPGTELDLVTYATLTTETVVTDLEFCLLGTPPVPAHLSRPDGSGLLPDLLPAEVQIGDFFIRGDVNGDVALTLEDPILALNGLFNGVELPCRDAVDVDDDGSLQLVDPIQLLGVLFSGSAPPPEPYPDCGADPTADEIDCVGPTDCP